MKRFGSGSTGGSMGSASTPSRRCSHEGSTSQALIQPLLQFRLYSKHLDFPDVPVRDPSTRWQRPDNMVSSGPRLLEFISEMVDESMSSYGDIVTIGEAAVAAGDGLKELISAQGERTTSPGRHRPFRRISTHSDSDCNISEAPVDVVSIRCKLTSELNPCRLAHIVIAPFYLDRFLDNSP